MIRMDKSAAACLLATKTTKLTFARGPIEDNFSNREEITTPAVKFPSIEEIKAAEQVARKVAIDATTSERKKDLEMRMHWGEYTDIFFGSRLDGSRNFN